MEGKETKTDTGKEIAIERLVNAPLDLVWEVWTNPDHIKHWWGPAGFTNTIFVMDVRPGGTWEFIMHGPDGTNYKNKHIYIEVVPRERIVLDHITAPKFRMIVNFESRGDQTLVSIQSIFESETQLAEVIRVFKADEGMKQNILRLKEYAERIANN